METLILKSSSKKDLELLKEIALKIGVSVADQYSTNESANQKRKRLIALAKKLDASAVPDPLSMEEIVEECNIVRKENYEKRKNNS